MKLRNILAGAGVLAALALASGAQAGSPYNLGTLTLTQGLSQTVLNDQGAVDDIFNFKINPPELATYADEISFTNLAPGVFDATTTIGLFTSGGTLIGTAEPIVSSPHSGTVGVTLTENLQPGNYYVQVMGNTLGDEKVDYTLGIVGAAVPEPAAWAMMIVGLGLIGGSLRTRARRLQGATA